jgi:predicted nuclease of restriction endonuclease-like (RecB) superfamily
MTTYQYELIKVEAGEMDADTVQEVLNEMGDDGFRFIAVQKFWTHDEDYNPIQKNYIVLEKSQEEIL